MTAEPRHATLTQARQLFDLFQYKLFSMRKINAQNLPITESDIAHIQIFGMLDKKSAGACNRCDYTYRFVKNPWLIE
jgi:uncharacterized UBP type Zn finger protein